MSLLETEHVNRKMNHIMRVHFHTPLDQEIEGRHGPHDTGKKVGSPALADFLAMENSGEHSEHRQHGFHQYPRVPGALRTDIHAGRIAGRGMEIGIGQDHHLVVKLATKG
jgi:hypothetical protein